MILPCTRAFYAQGGSSRLLEIIGIHPLDRVCPHRAESEVVLDHELGERIAVD